MAISFGTGGGVKEMQVWYNADTTGGWGGANDGLEGTGAQIEGNDCIIAHYVKTKTYQSRIVALLRTYLQVRYTLQTSTRRLVLF